MRKVRSFLAAPLTEEIRHRILTVRDELIPLLPGIRWASIENLHITLKFFGDIPEDSLEKIGNIMLSVGSFNPSFSVKIAGLGAFPSPARSRVFWLGIEGAPLIALQAELDRALEDAGIPRDDRPFSPHLTLGRTRGRTVPAREIVERFQSKSCGIQVIDRLILFESRLHPGGAEHIPLKTVFLGGR